MRAPPPLYYRDDAVALHEERVFGNLEWRPHPRLLVNAGGFWGNHNWKGEYFSPRLMANFQLAVDHTLRAGMTESTRMPTLFELAGDVRYYWNGILIGHTFDASGTVVPERLYVREVGYFGNFRDWRLTLDVRGFDERMEGRITGNKGTPQDFINDAEFRVRGFEYQMRWKPLPDTEVWLNQAFTRLIWANGSDTNQPPGHVTTAALFQKLPDGFDLTLLYHVMGAMTWNDQKDSLPPRHRLDARIARQFMMGGQRVEASLAIQAANGSYVEYLPTKNFTFERRAFGTLRLEF